jgi:hypothetical protein
MQVLIVVCSFLGEGGVMVGRNSGGRGSRESGRGNAADGMTAELSKIYFSGDHRGPLPPALHTKPDMHPRTHQVRGCSATPPVCLLSCGPRFALDKKNTIKNR